MIETTLGEVCELAYGKSLPKGQRDGAGSGVFGSNGRVGSHSQTVTSGPTVVVGRKGSIGRVHWSESSCWPIDTTYYVDSSKTDQDLRWLYHMLSSLGLESMNKSAAIPGLNREDAYRLPILLPPMGEQRRIAGILDEADALRAKRRRTLELLDELTQSIFLDMFGDPISNPRGWPISRLGDVVALFAGGTLPAGVPFGGQNDGYLLLKVSDLNAAGADSKITAARLWSPNPGPKGATAPGNSVVFPKRGGAIGTDKKRWVERPAVLDPNLMAISPHPRSLTLPYLLGWMRTWKLEEIASGSSVPQLNKKDLQPLQIPTPPLCQQEAFGRASSKLAEQLAAAESMLSGVDDLFASLQSRAFSGGL